MSSLHSFSPPSLLVNCIVLSWDYHDLRLLVQQATPWDKQGWSLPLAAVKEKGLDATLQGMVRSYTQTEQFHFQQVCTQVSEDKVHGSQAVVVSYFALLHWDFANANLPQRELTPLEWVPLADLPNLPEQEAQVFKRTCKQLRNQIRYEALVFELLPPKFSLSQMQAVYEALLGYPLDKRNFRKKMQSLDLVQGLNEFEKDVPYRAAKLFCFDPIKFRRFQEKGFHLKL